MVDFPFSAKPSFNPIKAGGSESMYINVYSPIFQGQLIEQKIRPITFIVLALGKVEKRQKKKGNKMYFLFCFLNKYHDMFLHSFFKGFSKI